jgi:iron complex transport system substrate-binding protein
MEHSPTCDCSWKRLERGVKLSASFQPLDVTRVPTRVVSLVPSFTESMIDLGVGDTLVGITDYCHVSDEIAGKVERVGGILDSDVSAITALKPDLVIADQEENDRSTVEKIQAAGIRVWVTFTRCVEDSVKILWEMVRLFDVEQQSGERIRVMERSLDWVSRAARDQAAIRVFCPIWREQIDPVGTYWMTFNWDTYSHSVLLNCGGVNIFEDRERHYPLMADLGREESEDPGECDTRYPRILPDEVIERDPEIVLIPSEPYEFSSADINEIEELLAKTSAVRTGNIVRIDGRLVTWHGTRLAKAIAELPVIFSSAAGKLVGEAEC